MTMYVRTSQPIAFIASDGSGDQFSLGKDVSYEVLPLWVAQESGFTALWAAGTVQVATDTGFTQIITSIPSSELSSSTPSALAWAIRQTGDHQVPGAMTYWANKSVIPSAEDTGQTVYPFGTAEVTNGLLTFASAGSPAAYYWQVNPVSPVTRFGCRFTLGSVTSGTTTNATVCIGLGMNQQITSSGTLAASGFHIPVHFTISATNWTLGYYQGSTASATYLQTGTFNNPLSVSNVVYETEIYQSGNTVTILLPDGTVQTFTNANYASTGNWAFVELYTNASTDNIPSIQEHWWDIGTHTTPTRQFITQEQAQQATASRLARPGANLVYSPNFQSIQAWEGASASNASVGVPLNCAISTAKSFNGTQSMAITSTGVFQQLNVCTDTYGTAVNVETCAGRVYRFQGQILAKSGNANTGNLIVAIQAFNGSLASISYPYLSTVAASSLSSSTWTQFVGYAVMPTGTCYMNPLFICSTTVNGDVFYLDALVVEDATLAYGLGYRS